MRGIERTKYIRFLYWLDDNFAELVHDLSFDEIADEYMDEMDSNLVTLEDVTVSFEADSEVILDDFEFEDDEQDAFISGE